MEYLSGTFQQVESALNEITAGLRLHNGLIDIKSYANICESFDGYYIVIDSIAKQYLSDDSLELVVNEIKLRVSDETY